MWKTHQWPGSLPRLFRSGGHGKEIFNENDKCRQFGCFFQCPSGAWLLQDLVSDFDKGLDWDVVAQRGAMENPPNFFPIARVIKLPPWRSSRVSSS